MGNTQGTGVIGLPRFIATPGPSSQGSRENSSWRKYDYIIVGGGTAGCVLAARLTEDPSITVLLIEAGKDSRGDTPTTIPYTFTKLFRTQRDWNLHTTEQRPLNDRETYWPAGKILGGTSATNASIYHRCPPEDFAEWTALGAEGWSYADLNPYFLKAEHFHPSPKHPKVNVAHHGSFGPLQTGFPSETAPINDFVVESCQELGLKSIDDVNSGRSSIGVTRFVGTLDTHGRRKWSSTASAYLTNDVLGRPNLSVGVGIRVEKVFFAAGGSGETPRAIGVQMATSRDATQYCAAATREVILSGGTVGTPQILLLSGIGPAEDLNKLSIPVVKDLPAVGRNVVDHISTGPLAFRAQPDLTYDYLNSIISKALATLKWYALGTGPLSSMAWSSAAFVRSTDVTLPFYVNGEPGAPVNDNSSGPGAPDLELLWFPQTVFDDALPKPTSSMNGVTFSAVALKPESRGRIMLKSSSAWDKPFIDPNYLSTESDMNVLVRGVRLIMRLARTDPVASKLSLKTQTTDSSSPWWPGDADPNKITDREIRDMLRRTAVPGWNPVSSARMGGSAADSVVDKELRVHGVAGLRCVDASVFPTQVSGHPCAVVVAIAEKAADMIKQGLQK